MTSVIALELDKFDSNKNWLKGSMLHFANKKTQSSLQKLYFWLRGSNPLPREVRSIFGKVVTFSIPQGKGFPPKKYKGYEVGDGFFERLLFSEDEVFGGVKNTCHFFKRSKDGPFREVNKVAAMKLKKKLQSLIRGKVTK